MPLGGLSKQLEAARETTRRIKALDHRQFSNEGVKTTLPYPALEHVYAGDRPGEVVEFVGRRNLYPAAVKRVLTPRRKYRGKVLQAYRGVLITGPSGSGKSCLLRAIACQLIGTLPGKAKVICFWYFNAHASWHRQVQDALLFTYCNECEVDTGLAQRIRQTKDVQVLAEFLEDRREKMGEVFYLVTDGEERLDALTWEGSDANIRAEERQWLDLFDKEADFVLKALSPKAEAASSRGRRKDLFRWEVPELFQKTEVQTFLADSLLGQLLKKRPKRWSDVEFFAGAHPLSLWRLDMCCMDYVLDQVKEDEVKEDEEWVHLFDRDSWSSVLASFRCGEPFHEIRESMRLKRAEDVSAGDRSFRLGEGFCTDYIRTVYMDAAAENVQVRKYRCPELIAYVDMILRRGVDFHNWSALGWACETFMGDAILKVGLTISGLEHIAPKTVAIIYGGQPTKLNVTKLNPGESAYWTPARYSLKYIDGLILYRDKEGVIHLIALQDAVNPTKHRMTEHKFMQERHVQKWLASSETIRLHYVYICPQMPANMQRNGKVAKGDKVVGEMTAELDYSLHVEPMGECIPKMSQHEYRLLQRLAGAREEALNKRADEKRKQDEDYRKSVDGLPDELQKMHGRKRAALEEIARIKGIPNPSKAMFQTKLEAIF